MFADGCKMQPTAHRLTFWRKVQRIGVHLHNWQDQEIQQPPTRSPQLITSSKQNRPKPTYPPNVHQTSPDPNTYPLENPQQTACLLEQQQPHNRQHIPHITPIQPPMLTNKSNTHQYTFILTSQPKQCII